MTDTLRPEERADVRYWHLAVIGAEAPPTPSAPPTPPSSEELLACFISARRAASFNFSESNTPVLDVVGKFLLQLPKLKGCLWDILEEQLGPGRTLKAMSVRLGRVAANKKLSLKRIWRSWDAFALRDFAAPLGLLASAKLVHSRILMTRPLCRIR